MTPQTSFECEFADGKYLFDLRLPQLAELQTKRGCGVFALYARVMAGRAQIDGQAIGIAWQGEAYAEDLFETIRLALIGGGKGIVDGAEVEIGPLRASQLIEAYGHNRPLRETWALAAAILLARIEGYADPKKAEPPIGAAARRSTSRKS